MHTPTKPMRTRTPRCMLLNPQTQSPCCSSLFLKRTRIEDYAEFLWWSAQRDFSVILQS